MIEGEIVFQRDVHSCASPYSAIKIDDKTDVYFARYAEHGPSQMVIWVLRPRTGELYIETLWNPGDWISKQEYFIKAMKHAAEYFIAGNYKTIKFMFSKGHDYELQDKIKKELDGRQIMIIGKEKCEYTIETGFVMPEFNPANMYDTFHLHTGSSQSLTNVSGRQYYID